jgi:hypothetical protein
LWKHCKLALLNQDTDTKQGKGIKMFKSAFNAQLAFMSIFAIAAFALVPTSMFVAEMVWVGGSALTMLFNRG